LACEAATAAGVPGRFRTWQHAGLLAVQATDPALSFLSTVSGVTRKTLPAAIDLVNVWGDGKPTVVASAELGGTVPGLTRVADRILAVARLEARPTAESNVVEVGSDDTFSQVLLAGYEVNGPVAAFISAEHRHPMVRRFLLLEHDTPIAAAAMTIHDDVAVLGGASTLPAHRGRGAQSRLLRHRLHTAAAAGCALAVATATPDSVSAANLRRAGFRMHRRSAWTLGG
jgi:ribosomal protein S18 acetylase RimI-like enzyme